VQTQRPLGWAIQKCDDEVAPRSDAG